ncbi:hypothetical protein [Mycobacteroides abscessus]|uniref:hypothetical protein n=1 Tax=Mycobacteroides abscessus TaxID=36809 RepID=UPI00092BA135|nr:hypothetical protein [Mycobacteroides abscessus]SIM00011.1 Uncharacterised protein [Mycobacteroides abscessus subsp. abscessus]
MNAIFAPFGTVSYGKHTAGFIKGNSLSPNVYVGRHRRDEQAEALSDFFTDRDGREAASAILKAGA